VHGFTREYTVPVLTAVNDKAGYLASTTADRTLRLRLLGLAGSKDRSAIAEAEAAVAQEQANDNPEHPSNNTPEENGEPAPDVDHDAQNMLRDYIRGPYADALGVKPTGVMVRKLVRKHTARARFDELTNEDCAAMQKALAETIKGADNA
jgi:hypothetical protein